MRAETYNTNTKYPTPIASVNVLDMKANEDFQIDFRFKTAEKSPMQRFTPAFVKDPVAWHAQLAERDGELVGEEELNGRKTLLYKLKQFSAMGENLREGQSVKVWINPETRLPVQIVSEQTTPGAVGTNPIHNLTTYSDFKWNEPIDPDLFNTGVPEGYELNDTRPHPPDKK